MKVTKITQVMMLVSIVLIKYHQLACLLLNVSPPNQLKKTIGEKVLPFTRLPKLEIRIVRWLWTVKVYQCNIIQIARVSWIRGCTPPSPVQSIMNWLHDTWDQTMMSYPSQFQSLQRQDLVWCDHHKCRSSHIRWSIVVRQKYHHLQPINMCKFERR